MNPFLRWPGGKRWLVQSQAHLLPHSYNTYIEPFLGGGSVYFHLQPARAVLSDINDDLIATYRGVRAAPRRVQSRLSRFQRLHSQQHYDALRHSAPSGVIARAARFIYLNRTAFNGIYRVNKQGLFNVPMGDRVKVAAGCASLQAAAKILRGTHLVSVDFEDSIDSAGKRDLVFADPPYTVRHGNNGFRKYNEVLFSWPDQVRLAQALARARDRGAIIIATNANHRCIRELYRPLGFAFTPVTRYSGVSASAESRQLFSELVIRSHAG